MLTGPEPTIGDRDGFVAAVHDALYASKIVSYAQGFTLIAAAAAEHGWDLDLGRIAQLWRSGCIVRARFLDDITAAFARDPGLPSLLLDPFFAGALSRGQQGWRRVVAAAVKGRDPGPGLRLGARLLRLLSQQASPRQPDPGATGLLRRPHLRACRPAAGVPLPHVVDRPGCARGTGRPAGNGGYPGRPAGSAAGVTRYEQLKAPVTMCEVRSTVASGSTARMNSSSLPHACP